MDRSLSPELCDETMARLLQAADRLRCIASELDREGSGLAGLAARLGMAGEADCVPGEGDHGEQEGGADGNP